MIETTTHNLFCQIICTYKLARYLDKDGELTTDSRYGPRAAGIPGVVAGLWLAHKTHGSLPWKELVEPSVKLAREGWPLDSFHADDMLSVSIARPTNSDHIVNCPFIDPFQ